MGYLDLNMLDYLQLASRRVHLRRISIFGNTEFKLIVLCCCILSCISILRSFISKLYCSLDDRAHFWSVCDVLH